MKKLMVLLTLFALILCAIPASAGVMIVSSTQTYDDSEAIQAATLMGRRIFRIMQVHCMALVQSCHLIAVKGGFGNRATITILPFFLI